MFVKQTSPTEIVQSQQLDRAYD